MWRNWQTRKVESLVGNSKYHAGSTPAIRIMDRPNILTYEQYENQSKNGTLFSGHYILKCSCGTVMSQCRCMGPKNEYLVLKGCDKCRSGR